MADPHSGTGSPEADRLRDLGREARDTGVRAAERGFEGARDTAAGRARRTSEALHDAADRLEGDPIGGAMHMAADRLDDLSSALRQQDLRGVLDQVQSFAQRQPALFVGGMMALGFALGRVVTTGGAEAADRARASAPRAPDPGHASADPDPDPGVGLGAPSEATRPRPTASAANPTPPSVSPSAEVTAPRGDETRTEPDTSGIPAGRPH